MCLLVDMCGKKDGKGQNSDNRSHHDSLGVR